VRLGILVGHPIQYYSPLFRELAKECDLTVFYAMKQTGAGQAKAGFGVAFDWDVDLLSGYKHVFLNNISKRPGTDHFSGCDTPEIARIIQKTKNRKQKTESQDFSSQLSTFNFSQFDSFLVIGWFLKSHWQAIRACNKYKVPVLIRGDSQLLTPRSRLKQLAKKLIYRWVINRFDGYLIVGQRAREYLLHYGAKPERMFFSPHFVDNGFFQERGSRSNGQALKKQWGIAEDALCILFCGKFIPKKRPMDLVRAATLLLGNNFHSSLLAPRFSCIHLLFVGSGELGPELRANCHVVFDAENPSLFASDGERAGVRCSQLSTFNSQLPKASFAGFQNQSEIPACYAAADLLVLPSDGGETWGLVVNEAMACGVPAVVSDAVGCAPDLIEPGVTGEIFPVENIESLAQAIIRFIPKLGCEETRDALANKMNCYSVETAAAGVIKAVTCVRSRRF
jgi:glycosyltransferase involved in cell wall biosynthesis